MAKYARRKRYPDRADINILSRGNMSDPAFRNMVDNVHIGCYVEAEHTCQSGTVVDIIRDYCGRAACLKVECMVNNKKGEGVLALDYIPVDRVTFYEPYNFWVPNDAYNWEQNEREKKFLLNNGYRWDDTESCYKNDETGDVVVW